MQYILMFQSCKSFGKLSESAQTILVWSLQTDGRLHQTLDMIQCMCTSFRIKVEKNTEIQWL